MVNQKGEFPMKARVSTRIHESTKRLLKTLPYTEAEVIKIGAEYLANESNMLSWEIGELELEISEIKKDLHSKEAYLKAKQNRLRMIAPSKLDESTLESMFIESVSNIVETIYKRYGDSAIDAIETTNAKRSVMNSGKELGYDGMKFLVEVKNQLELKCQIGLSDSSTDNSTEMSDD